ncbi:MAG: hypothetical protein HYW33_01810 [Candidatus Blackburnbacteria bacterium]|nr:hypothetical protein [Candidatus Blackburnbacteria bacterium]
MAMGNEERNSQLRFTRREIITTVFSASAASVAANALKPLDALADGSQVPLEQFLPPSAINIEKDPNKIAEMTKEMISKINGMFRDAEARVQATAYRISNAWLGQDGFKYIAFQRAIFQMAPSGDVFLWNTLDNMSEAGFDPRLDSGELGVTIPPKQRFNDRAASLEGIFAERNEVLRIPEDVQLEAKDIRRVVEIGVPTGYKNYGPYEVWRYQRIALMKWSDGPDKGLIQGILAGEAAKAAGFIPQDVLLPVPDLGSGGGNPEDARTLPWPERFSHENTEFVNRGKRYGVIAGDVDFFKNLFYLRDKYATLPDIRRYLYFYDSYDQMVKESNVPFDPNNMEFTPETDLWLGTERRWKRNVDGSLEFHVALPLVKTGTDLKYVSAFITQQAERSLWSNSDGKYEATDRYGVAGATQNSPKGQDFMSHPIARTTNDSRTALQIVVI